MKKVKTIKGVPKYSVGTNGITPNLTLSKPLYSFDPNQLGGTTAPSGFSFNENWADMTTNQRMGAISGVLGGAASLYNIAASGQKPTVGTALSGITTGASAGSALGPIGAGAGAFMGLLAGTAGSKYHVNRDAITTTSDVSESVEGGGWLSWFGPSKGSQIRKATGIQNSKVAYEQTANARVDYANDPRNQPVTVSAKDGGVISKKIKITNTIPEELVHAKVSKGELYYDPYNKTLSRVPGSPDKPNTDDDEDAFLARGGMIVTNSDEQPLINGKTQAIALAPMVDKPNKNMSKGTIEARDRIVRKVTRWNDLFKTKDNRIDNVVYAETGDSNLSPIKPSTVVYNDVANRKPIKWVMWNDKFGYFGDNGAFYDYSDVAVQNLPKTTWDGTYRTEAATTLNPYAQDWETAAPPPPGPIVPYTVKDNKSNNSSAKPRLGNYEPKSLGEPRGNFLLQYTKPEISLKVDESVAPKGHLVFMPGNALGMGAYTWVSDEDGVAPVLAANQGGFGRRNLSLTTDDVAGFTTTDKYDGFNSPTTRKLLHVPDKIDYTSQFEGWDKFYTKPVASKPTGAGKSGKATTTASQTPPVRSVKITNTDPEKMAQKQNGFENVIKRYESKQPAFVKPVEKGEEVETTGNKKKFDLSDFYRGLSVVAPFFDRVRPRVNTLNRPTFKPIPVDADPTNLLLDAQLGYALNNYNTSHGGFTAGQQLAAANVAASNLATQRANIHQWEKEQELKNITQNIMAYNDYSKLLSEIGNTEIDINDRNRAAANTINETKLKSKLNTLGSIAKELKQEEIDVEDRERKYTMLKPLIEEVYENSDELLPLLKGKIKKVKKTKKSTKTKKA